MGNSFDDMLKERLTKEKFVIPESYDEAVEKTIQEMEKDNKINLWKWMARHKLIRAAVVFLALVSASVSAMAAISAYQKRMQSIPKRVVEKYNEDVQTVQADADSFSRALSEMEEKELVRLREAYEKSLKFPEREILQAESREEIPENALCFVAKESKFYLPIEKLTEEEMLEIIDLQEKRAYSVAKKNQTDHANDVNGDVRTSLEKTAKQAIHRVYEVNEKELDLLESNSNYNGEELLYSCKGIHFSVFLTRDGIAERIISEKDGVDAHKNDQEIENLLWAKISKLTERRVRFFTGRKVKKKSAYSVMNGKKSAKGTISFYCELSDGTGCVAVYSIARGEIYDIYTESMDAMKKDIEERKVHAEKVGFLYKRLKNINFK